MHLTSTLFLIVAVFVTVTIASHLFGGLARVVINAAKLQMNENHAATVSMPSMWDGVFCAVLWGVFYVCAANGL